MSVAVNKSEQAPFAATTAAANERATTMTLDPRLFMAARRGDSTELKNLLKLKDGGSNEEHIGAEAAEQVVVEVLDHQRRPAAATAASASGLLDGVTIEGDSLLHVIAACGDEEKFLDCAKLLFCHNNDLLAARNDKGDTPLHCAAGAGKEKMVNCLILLATSGETIEAKELLRVRNKNEETVLHLAIRARSQDVVNKLLSVDPELTSNDAIPNAASPLYLAVSLGELDIARRLFNDASMTDKGKLSTYSGPHGRNVLHAAAVSPGRGNGILLSFLNC